MTKQQNLVHCRYPKCNLLHESTELSKDCAIKGGGKNSYYHPDCYHTMQTINQIRDIFVQQINPLLTGKQIGMLVSTINNIVFTKGVDVYCLQFAVEYFIHNKPGALKHPQGLHYIIQDRDMISAWKKEQDKRIRQQMRDELKRQAEVIGNDVEVGEFNLTTDNSFNYKPNKKSRFSSVLGV